MRTIHFYHFFKTLLYVTGIAVCITACNKDGEITTEGKPAPKITLDSEMRIYSAKVGSTLIITPEIENDKETVYSWKLNGKIISGEKILEYIFEEEGTFYMDFRVDSRYGSDEVDLKVEVSDKAYPLISLIEPQEGFEVAAGKEYIFSPDVQNSEQAVYSWKLNGIEVATEKDYTFSQTETGMYILSLTATNEDGSDEKSLLINVVESIPLGIVFVTPYYQADAAVKTVSLGRTLYLRPYIENARNPSFTWSVDGIGQNESGCMFAFTPTEKGKSYEVTLTVKEAEEKKAVAINRNVTELAGSGTSSTIEVQCYGEESTLIKNTTGKASFNKVFEYTPAPGQFINNSYAGFTSAITSPEAAAEFAYNRMNETKYISLGGFGGYVIVGFDHSIEAKGGYQGYDFSVTGNMFDGSSEPGIVWVMQDVNGNGLPDDEWYELKGSEYGKPETIQEYSVTYIRPASDQLPVRWMDNQGKNGSLLLSYYQHGYYPNWIDESRYTLYGTRLEERISYEKNIWRMNSYEWGYADNYGNDRLTNDENAGAGPSKNYFKISNAVDLAGNPANLQFIDFVKIQNGVNARADILGEVSTEVFGITDENL